MVVTANGRDFDLLGPSCAFRCHGVCEGGRYLLIPEIDPATEEISPTVDDEGVLRLSNDPRALTALEGHGRARRLQ